MAKNATAKSWSRYISWNGKYYTSSTRVPAFTGDAYRFPPPAVGSREFQAVNIPVTGLDTGTGTGQRYTITFSGNDGYLLLCPPSTPITGTVDIETNAKTIVIHGAEFLPNYAVEKVTGPAGNKTVGKVLDIFTTGSNSPEIYILKCRFRTTDDAGNVVWNAGDPINVGGYQSSDTTKWPTVYVEQNWIDNLYGFAADTVGHTDIVKSNSGPVRGFRIARNRWGCSYQFFILFQSWNETYGAYPGGTNEFYDNQWYSINTPVSWSEPVANNLYLSTSYTTKVANGYYHAYKFNGTGAGGSNGWGTYIDKTGNTQDADLTGIMSPPAGYGFNLSGSDLVAIAGQPSSNRNNDQDWVQGTVYNGTHPKLADTTTRDRPVLVTETGKNFRITTQAQLETIVSTPVAPTLSTPSMSSSSASIVFSGGRGYATLIPQYSTDSGSTWTSIASQTTSPITFTGLSTGSYSFRVLADGSASYVSNVVTGTVGTYTPAVSLNFDSDTSLPAFFDSYGYGSISTAQKYGGTGKSVACSIAAAGHDWGLAGRLNNRLVQGDEIWIRFRTFFPTGYDFTASPHLKFFRIDQGTTASGGHGAHIDWYIRFLGQAGDTNNVGYFDFIQEDIQSWLYDTTTVPTGIVRNQWQTWNIYYKLHATAASARIRLWRDSSLLVDVNTRATLGASGNVVGCKTDGSAQGIMFSTYWNGGAPATQTCYVDDWEIATNASPPTSTDSGGRIWIGL